MVAFTYIGDALWIIALAIMSSATLGLWRRTTPATQVPIRVGADGAVRGRAPRNIALLFVPVAAFGFSLILFVMAHNAAGDPERQVILFGVRAISAALFALADLTWMRSAMIVLDAEGALKPPQP